MPLGPSATIEDWIHDFVHSKNPKFDGKSKEERNKMAQGAFYGKQKAHKEEVESLVELSKKTLGSYIKKASRNAVGHAQKAERVIDSKKDHGTNRDNFGKAYKRVYGVSRAADKLSKEEVEQIDELSTKTLKSYSKKASKEADKHLSKWDKTGSDKSFNKALKRSEGINRAHQKLNKEEVMNKNELNEMMTRKHFQQVADVIKAHPSPKKRSELAHHHAGIFAASNPRFDHDRFFKAANAERYSKAQVKEEAGHEALFAAIIDGNRDEANDIFNAVVSDRLDGLVDARRKEIAGNLFNGTEVEEEVVEEELNLLGITEEFEPLELREDSHGHHHRIYSELTDRNKNLADAAANSYARGDITKDHKREIMRHFTKAEDRLEHSKDGLGSAAAADHLNAAAVHITDGGLHLQNVRTHTSLGIGMY